MLKLLPVFLLWVVLLDAAAASGVLQREPHRRDRQRADSTRRRFESLKFDRAKEIYRSDGGRIEEWTPDNFPALCDAEVGARRLTVEPNALAVPCYKDSPLIKVITRGSARVGIINPLADKLIDRSTVFRVTRGDVIALPRGTASWIYNDGDERVEVLEVADTSDSAECGRFQVFLLAGGKQRGGQSKRQEQCSSVLHGFSKEMLAHAFDVEERTVQHMLEGEGEAIIKLDERRRMSLPDESSSSSANTFFVNFVYRWSQAQPDVTVRDGGELRLLNSFKLPILKTLNMGGACMRMKPGALTAPGWLHNAHKVMYVEEGNGRIQVARGNGEQAIDETVKEGTLMVIPANFPSANLAGDQGLNYISIFTSDQPVESYIAGRNSVYKGMPSQVVSAGFQIDQQTQRQLEEARRDDAYIFPARKTDKRRDPSVLETFVGDMF